ncbi:hypothetical protein K3495_g8987 [Podosphaera aphanis]|nr:hypothetical protein K3495_g8987 [Podosphaera aphanis]
MKNVKERLTDDEEFRSRVNKWRRDYKPPKDKNNPNSQDSTSDQRPTKLPIVAMAST